MAIIAQNARQRSTMSNATGSLPNAAARLAYRAAYCAARMWWFVRRPETTSALVALWHADRVLMVRTSYRPHCMLPGGFLRHGEPPLAGARRELEEELSVAAAIDALAPVWYGTKVFEHRRDTLTIFEGAVVERPPVRIGNREIVWSDWLTSQEAQALQLLPHVRDYLEARDSGSTMKPGDRATARSL